jgi:hypothetical protein
VNGLGEIIARNARAAGKEPLAFTLHIVVDPKAVRETVDDADGRSIEQIVSDEIESSLDSLDYVESVVVRKKTI